MRKHPRARRKPNLRGVPVGHIIDSNTDTPRPEWRATCTACGWSTTAATYAAAGEAARAHGDSCADASTVVEAGAR